MRQSVIRLQEIQGLKYVLLKILVMIYTHFLKIQILICQSDKTLNIEKSVSGNDYVTSLRFLSLFLTSFARSRYASNGTTYPYMTQGLSPYISLHGQTPRKSKCVKVLFI